jgi:hypothetical protein
MLRIVVIVTVAQKGWIFEKHVFGDRNWQYVIKIIEFEMFQETLLPYVESDTISDGSKVDCRVQARLSPENMERLRTAQKRRGYKTYRGYFLYLIKRFGKFGEWYNCFQMMFIVLLSRYVRELGSHEKEHSALWHKRYRALEALRFPVVHYWALRGEWFWLCIFIFLSFDRIAFAIIRCERVSELVKGIRVCRKRYSGQI